MSGTVIPINEKNFAMLTNLYQRIGFLEGVLMAISWSLDGAINGSSKTDDLEGLQENLNRFVSEYYHPIVKEQQSTLSD